MEERGGRGQGQAPAGLGLGVSSVGAHGSLRLPCPAPSALSFELYATLSRWKPFLWLCPLFSTRRWTRPARSAGRAVPAVLACRRGWQHHPRGSCGLGPCISQVHESCRPCWQGVQDLCAHCPRPAASQPRGPRDRGVPRECQPPARPPGRRIDGWSAASLGHRPPERFQTLFHVSASGTVSVGCASSGAFSWFVF